MTSQTTQSIGRSGHERGVCFDPETMCLEGVYCDQLSAYRARRAWARILETTFLLEGGHDFHLAVLGGGVEDRFVLKCEFRTACARYAFWRLTNNQAPEAQYVIETAHIPHCDSRADELSAAPDLSPKEDMPLVLSKLENTIHHAASVREWLAKTLSKLIR